MSGVCLGCATNAEAVASFDIAPHEKHAIKTSLATGAQVLQCSVGVQLEIARLRMHARVVIGDPFEIEVRQQERGLNLNAAEALDL